MLFLPHSVSRLLARFLVRAAMGENLTRGHPQVGSTRTLVQRDFVFQNLARFDSKSVIPTSGTQLISAVSILEKRQ